MRTIGIALALAPLAVALGACGSNGAPDASRPCEGPGTGGPRVVYRAEPTPDAPRVTRAGVEQTIEVMCRRSRALGARGARIRRLSGNRIGVRLGPGPDAAQTAVALGVPARLALYDWDRNVIGNPDRPLPDLLRAVERAEAASAEAELEDLPPSGPDERTAARLNRDDERIRRFYDRANNASGATYYAESGGRIVAGPEASCAGLGSALDPRGPAPAASAAGDLDAAQCTARLAGRGLPTGGIVRLVPRGIRVVAAARPGGGAPGDEVDDLAATPSDRAAGYFVIEDDAGVLPQGIEGADARRDEATGSHGVHVELTEAGKEGFRALTRTIVEGAAERPGAGDPRLAAALDDQLVSLAAVDPVANPDGLNPDDGAVIADLGGEARSQLIAELLDAGALPLDVRPAP